MAQITQEKIDEIVQVLFNRLDTQEIELLKGTEKRDLILFHHTAGRSIRYEFRLWTYEWTPELDEDGVDHSKSHPDAVSGQIIEKVWERVQAK